MKGTPRDWLNHANHWLASSLFDPTTDVRGEGALPHTLRWLSDASTHNTGMTPVIILQ